MGIERKPLFNGRLLIKATLKVLLLFLIFGAGYLFGHKNLILDQKLVPKLVNTEVVKPRTIDFSLYNDVYNKLTESFPDPIQPDKILYQSIKGLVSSTGDPYSAFLDPTETKELKGELSGKLEGIGAEIGFRKGVLTIIAPLDGSPAALAGLHPLDQILKINGEQAPPLSLDEAISKIRGKPGTVVTLTIKRPNEDGEKDIKITRQKINVPDSEYKKLDGIGYLKIRQFGDEIEEKTGDLSQKIASSNPKGLVIDLRDNSGGWLSAAVQFSSLFLPKDKIIVKEKGKDGKEEIYKAQGDPKFPNLPVVVLVNEGSASAAEITAGALKDNDRAKIIGVKTFGKGSVQSFEDLARNTSLKVTVARWLTPSDHSIEGKGIDPDIEVKMDPDQPQKDPQLDKALELLPH